MSASSNSKVIKKTDKHKKQLIESNPSWFSKNKKLIIGTGIVLGIGAALIYPLTQEEQNLSKHEGGEERKNLFITSNGVRLQVHKWFPKQQQFNNNNSSDNEFTEVRGIIFLVHGLHEHLGRYEYVANNLTSQGFIVLGIDHQGHGKSDGDFGYVCSFSDLVSDYIEFIEAILEDSENSKLISNLPLFLLGHSMGGLIASLVAIKTRKKGLWNKGGIILSGPAIIPDPKVATPFIKSISSVVSKYLPKLQLIKLDINGLSRDPNVIQDAIDDPLYNCNGMRCRLAEQILSAMEKLRNSFDKCNFPFLVMHGTHDPLCRIEGSTLLYEKASSKDKTFKKWDGLYHEIFNEPEKDQVLKYMSQWINARINFLN